MKAHHDTQEKQVAQVLADTQKSYESIKALLPEVNPEAWKALLSVRGKIRRVRAGWLAAQLDKRIPHIDKDILVGQYNGALLFFEMIENIREIHKNMVPGKEADYIREKLFRNPHVQQQPK